MYEIITIEDVIAVPPEKFGDDLEKSVKESIELKFEGNVNSDIGVILSVTDINDIGEGKILPGDPAVHYPVKFSLLAWVPKLQEIIEGSIVDITEFGAFVRVGGFDGLIHISQVMDDFVSYDDKNAQLVGKQSHNVLKEGDKVRARIISISFKEQSKLGLTMRQPLLGCFRWSAPAEVKEVKEKKEKKKKEEK